MSQNLFLEVKKPEIKETKGTFIILTFKSSYWGPFSGLKSQDLIKTSRTFTGVIFAPGPFVAFSEYMNFIYPKLFLSSNLVSTTVLPKEKLL